MYFYTSTVGRCVDIVDLSCFFLCLFNHICLTFLIVGSRVVLWLALTPHSKKAAGSIPTRGFSVWNLHALLCLQGFFPGTPGALVQRHAR